MAANWTAPKTWSTGELVTASDMNTHLRDNLEFLKTPPSEDYMLDEIADYTTTSTTFVAVDATNLKLTLVTAGGDVLVGFSGAVLNTSNATYLDLAVDGTRWAGDDGIMVKTSSAAHAMTFVILVTGLSAGSHTFELQWKVAGGTAFLYAGAGTSTVDVHPQFWAREVS